MQRLPAGLLLDCLHHPLSAVSCRLNSKVMAKLKQIWFKRYRNNCASTIGSHCPHSGMSQPLPCPPGWSSTPGQPSCRSCNESSFLCGGVTAAAPRWSQPAVRSSQSDTCHPGTYKDTKAGMTCVICPAG